MKYPKTENIGISKDGVHWLPALEKINKGSVNIQNQSPVRQKNQKQRRDIDIRVERHQNLHDFSSRKILLKSDANSFAVDTFSIDTISAKDEHCSSQSTHEQNHCAPAELSCAKPKAQQIYKMLLLVGPGHSTENIAYIKSTYQELQFCLIGNGKDPIDLNDPGLKALVKAQITDQTHIILYAHGIIETTNDLYHIRLLAGAEYPELGHDAQHTLSTLTAQPWWCKDSPLHWITCYATRALHAIAEQDSESASDTSITTAHQGPMLFYGGKTYSSRTENHQQSILSIANVLQGLQGESIDSQAVIASIFARHVCSQAEPIQFYQPGRVPLRLRTSKDISRTKYLHSLQHRLKIAYPYLYNALKAAQNELTDTEKQLRWQTMWLLHSKRPSAKSLPILQALLKKAPELLNYQDSSGCTAIFLSSYAGQLKTLQWLYRKNAKLDMKNKAGYNLLTIACKKNHLAIVQWLVEQGIYQVTSRDENGYTAWQTTQPEQTELRAWLKREGANDEV